LQKSGEAYQRSGGETVTGNTKSGRWICRPRAMCGFAIALVFDIESGGLSMATSAAVRVTDIVSLLRTPRPRKWPEWLGAAASIGQLAAMQLFVDRGADLEQRGAFVGTPLCCAVSAGQYDAVRWLAARGAKLDPEGVAASPMRLALSKADCPMVALLLELGAPLPSAAWGAIVAAKLARLDMLRWLIGLGIDLDQSYPDVGHLRTRCLHNVRKQPGDEQISAYLRGEIDLPPLTEPPLAQSWRQPEKPLAPAEQRAALVAEAIDLIRAAGKNAARWKATGPSAEKRELLLSFAAGMGQVEIVEALLDAGASPEAADDGTAPPLTRAAAEAELDVVQCLLRRGARPDGKDGKSWLPLASACSAGEPQVVRALLDAGARRRAKPLGATSLKELVRGPFQADILAMLDA
jgi:hypothetical protein